MRLDCRKQVVTATIVTTDGRRFVGRNWMERDPGPVCPRDQKGYKSGEGYHLCRHVCGQVAHAEVNAIAEAGDAARGSVLYLEGHTYACDSCKAAAERAGVTQIVIGPPPEARERGAEAGVYTAGDIADLNQLVWNLSQQWFRIVTVIDTQNGYYHVVAQQEKSAISS